MVTKMRMRLSLPKARLETVLDHRGLSARIKDSSALIGIIGMGYVELPTMLASAAKKFRVLGFDIDEKKVNLSIRSRILWL
jgi:hypothetical protein